MRVEKGGQVRGQGKGLLNHSLAVSLGAFFLKWKKKEKKKRAGRGRGENLKTSRLHIAFFPFPFFPVFFLVFFLF